MIMPQIKRTSCPDFSTFHYRLNLQGVVYACLSDTVANRPGICPYLVTIPATRLSGLNAAYECNGGRYLRVFAAIPEGSSLVVRL
jgi:hypothetical protein